MNLTTDVKIFLGIIVGTIVLVIGAVIFLSLGNTPTPSAEAKVDAKVLARPDSWATGSASPKVTIVEFSDFQCPYCKDAESAIASVMTKHSDSVRFIYRHFPLIQAHQFAMDAAIAAEAAGKQGAFWPYHDLLFKNQPSALDQESFKREKLIEYARELGLNPDQFVKDFESDSTRQRVLDDKSAAEKIGVNSTPTFYVNGIKLETGFVDLLTTVESALSQ